MIVKEIDLFKGIDLEVMKDIANICTEENYAKGSVLFKAGERAECLYILDEGRLSLIIENGGSLIYALTDPGMVFGWSAMVESGRYTATSVCDTDLKALKIERTKLYRIFKLHPDAGFIVLKRLAGVISERLQNAYREFLSARRQDATPSYG